MLDVLIGLVFLMRQEGGRSEEGLGVEGCERGGGYGQNRPVFT